MQMIVKLGKFMWIILKESSVKRITYAQATAYELDLHMQPEEQQPRQRLT